MLSEFDQERIELPKKPGSFKITLATNMELTISTTFFLSIVFSGIYEKDCGATFNIMDSNNENIFHLDFRIFMKHSYRKIIQSSKQNGKWIEGDFGANLPDLSKTSKIFVVVTGDVFEVSINNVVVEPKYPVDLARLAAFKELKIYQFGSCFLIDLEKSYMNNDGEHVF